MRISKIVFQIILLIILGLLQTVKNQQRQFKLLSGNEPDIPIVKWGRRLIGGFLQNFQEIESNKHCDKFQTEYPKSMKFVCDGKNGPGKRSSVRPTSIHQLRPGDIDIVAAMGDSLTAGHGVAGTNLLDMAVENRGMVFSIGGQKTWRKYMTLPNILKEFNPKLYGYSLGNSLTIDRRSKFNVAEGAAASHDIKYQAMVLKYRLMHDPKVNMTHDWKIVTTFLGGIDICHTACYYSNIDAILDKHERELVKGLRYLRDNIPRLMVNIVSPSNVRQIFDFNLTYFCKSAYELICPCFQNKEKYDYAEKIIFAWYKRDEEIAKRVEFNTNEFTVNIIPFTQKFKVPQLKNGMLDLRYFSIDCIHFSQKLHHIGAIAYWNNLLEREGEKSDSADVNDQRLKCPTEERPFIATRINSLN